LQQGFPLGERQTSEWRWPQTEILSFPRRRESMGQIGLRLGLGLELGLLRACRNGFARALWIPAFAGMTPSDMLCVWFEGPSVCHIFVLYVFNQSVK
jgi:hypothetical protein